MGVTGGQSRILMHVLLVEVPGNSDVRMGVEAAIAAAGHVLAVHIGLTGAVDQRAQRFDLRLQFGQPKPDDLEVHQNAPERLPLAAVVAGQADAAVHDPQRRGRAPHALLLELLHLVGEPLARLADAVLLGHADLIEEDGRGV